MEIACLVIPHFAVRVEEDRDPRLKDRPVVLVGTGPDSQTVQDASESAGGAIPGMPLSRVVSHYSEVVVIPANPACYLEVWEQVLNCLEKLCPFVENSGLGCAYLDIGGLAKLYGGEDKALDTLLGALPASFGAQIGVAPSKFPAHLAAISSTSGKWLRVPSDTKAFLASFPVDVLPASREIVSRLKSFGLRTLGDIAVLPLGALQAQFGWPGKLIWELTNGIDRRPLLPHKREVIVREAIDFSTPAITIEALLTTLEGLLTKAFSRKELRGRLVRVATLEASIFRASPFTRRITFKDPVAGKERAYFIFKGMLSDLKLPGPIEAITLTLAGIGGEAGRQASLFNEVRRKDNLREILKELELRFSGVVPIYKFREVEPWSRIPERRRVLVPYSP